MDRAKVKMTRAEFEDTEHVKRVVEFAKELLIQHNRGEAFSYVVSADCLTDGSVEVIIEPKNLEIEFEYMGAV